MCILIIKRQKSLKRLQQKHLEKALNMKGKTGVTSKCNNILPLIQMTSDPLRVALHLFPHVQVACKCNKERENK